MPRFSLLMTTEDRPQYIEEAINAVITQDFDNWELLVYDAGKQHVRSLVPPDPRIKYTWVPGLSFPFRLDCLLDDAVGDIRAFCWDDDVLAPGTLNFVDAAMRGQEWLYGRIKVFPGGWVNGQPWNYDLLKTRNIVPCPAAFWTREIQERITFDTSLAAIDYDAWLRMGALSTPVYTERVLSNYRLHPGQDSNLRGQQVAAETKMISDRALAGYYEHDEHTSHCH